MSCQTVLVSISAWWKIAALSPCGGIPSGSILQLTWEATATVGFKKAVRNRARERERERERERRQRYGRSRGQMASHSNKLIGVSHAPRCLSSSHLLMVLLLFSSLLSSSLHPPPPQFASVPSKITSSSICRREECVCVCVCVCVCWASICPPVLLQCHWQCQLQLLSALQQISASVNRNFAFQFLFLYHGLDSTTEVVRERAALKPNK